MAEEKEVKKLEEFKDSEENKKIITENKVETKKAKEESMPAVEKKTKTKKDDKKSVVELEREYIVPLKRGVLKAPHYRRAKKAVRVLKEFIVKHMKVRDRDLKKVKIDMYLNNELWFRGIKKPMNKIKVKAKKIDGIVYVELAEIPVAVGYKIAREEKKKIEAANAKVKMPKKSEEEKKTEEEKTEEKENVKAGAEKAAKTEKVAVKTEKHTSQGKHAKKSMPVRKVLK